MKRASRIALRLSTQQRIAFAQHAGAARFAWNWGLARKQEERAAGRIYENPRALEKAAAKLRRAQKAVVRSQRGSERRKRKLRRVGRIHQRVANLRKAAIHKATSDIASRFRSWRSRTSTSRT